jgi:hypothetical protein
MDRRDFVKDSLLALGGSALLGTGLGQPLAFASPEKNVKLHIDYPQKQIPRLELPSPRGQWYEDTVPDTLDIAHRCELAINALTGITDPNADDEVYWEALFFRNPAIMMHDHNDWVESNEGLMEALPLLRDATGSTLNRHVDLVWEQVNLKSIGPDGLTYAILKGIPWSRLNPWNFHFIWTPEGTRTDPSNLAVNLATTPAKCGRILGTMAVYYLHDRNPVWTKTCERMIGRLQELAVDKGDYAYVPAGAYEPYGKCGSETFRLTGKDAVNYGTLRMIQGLTQYHKVTGYEPAIKLAAKITAFGMGPAGYYDAEGRFLMTPGDRHALLTSKRMKRNYPQAKNAKYGGHFHGHTIGLISMLEYAAALRDRAALEFVDSGFRWAKDQGSSLVGFFPELAIDRLYLTCESCEVADMIGIAVKLTEAGVGDYWDDVDRWVRNQFAEQQMQDGAWIYQLEKTQEKKPVAYNETADRLAERCRGSFAGWASANEWATLLGIQQCCLGNSSRALYYVWERMLERKGEDLQANLLLNRASAWADVYSHIPYEGRVDFKIKQPCRQLRVRAPEWIKGGSREIVCKVNGTSRTLHWEGRYVEAGHAAPGDKVVITFPIAERTVKETIGDVPYTLTIKGNTVTTIDPPGRIGPMYNRAYYRKDRAPMQKVRRFVPDSPIYW